MTCLIFFLLLSVYNFYGSNGIKTGQKTSRSKFVGTMGHNDKKGDNPVLNGSYGHPRVHNSDGDNMISIEKMYFLLIFSPFSPGELLSFLCWVHVTLRDIYCCI
jgi:hypothetical protein